ncbi:MAG: ATP-binding cassette domain-containing protein [Chthoniobacterales bacterium]
MLELRDISYHAGELPLLQHLTLDWPSSHFGAILGPSGCGKTTLLRLIAGLHNPSEGTLLWQGRDLLTEGDLHPSEIGYVPQFSIAYDALTVRESLASALRLRVAELREAEQTERIEKTLLDCGLDAVTDRPVAVLSGGQKRRLSLAIEMLTSPRLLLCDEVLSGLDPKSEREIIDLLHRLSKDGNRLILNVTHSLAHLELYDSVTVLTGGNVAYHGPTEHLAHYFDVLHHEEIFDRLGKRKPEKWSASWKKHGPAFELDSTQESPGETSAPLDTPGFLSQFFTLLSRRWLLWRRDSGGRILQFAMLFGFPLLVVIFAIHGLPEIQNLNLRFESNVVRQLAEANAYIQSSTRDGSLLSGIAMFQVILLTLMASNNGAREIANERTIFEKEKLAGLSPLAYLASKLAYLGFWVVAQSLWMAAFVNIVCHLPGSLATQAFLLFLVNAAVTAISLALSACLKTPEQASLASIYFVGFQLPLSGAFLALPLWLANVVKPFIAAYWAWSGYLQTFRETNYYTILQRVVQTPLADTPACIWFLGSQIVVAIFVAWLGCRRSQWS